MRIVSILDLGGIGIPIYGNHLLQSLKKIFETLIFMQYSAVRDKFIISASQKFFVSINKILILSGRLGTRLSF